MKELRAKFQPHFTEAFIVKTVSKLWKECQATDTITVWLTTRGIINPAQEFGVVKCSVQPQLQEGKYEHALSFPGISTSEEASEISGHEYMGRSRESIPRISEVTRTTLAANESYAGVLLQRQQNLAQLICKLALVDGLQGPEIIGVYPKLHCHETQSMEKALQPLCDCAVAITKAFCMFASKYFKVYHGYYNKRTPAMLLYFVPRKVQQGHGCVQEHCLLELGSKICSLEQG
ncbi:hypothetical protein HGM15179_004132 [Zosterops borbonicus]|uniref:Uncharacterized protein n=1 Tax=Zosterops borbonicus TaxID=364589 RepID=A0A8K1GT82_9PASS|nr:hypothetical protein HGM15179_004132 [Zosterops borbonicus]